jgi:hypothetical protein
LHANKGKQVELNKLHIVYLLGGFCYQKTIFVPFVKIFANLTKIAQTTVVKTVAIFDIFGYNLSLCMQLHKE